MESEPLRESPATIAGERWLEPVVVQSVPWQLDGFSKLLRKQILDEMTRCFMNKSICNLYNREL